MRRLVALVAAAAALAMPVASPAAAAEDGPVATPEGTGPVTHDGATPRLTTPILSPRRTPGLVTSLVAEERLRRDVGAVLADAPATTCAQVEVGQRTLLDHNAELPLVPASNQKLVTSSAVLEAYPPELRLTTVVASADPVVDGVVAGDLFLVGGGDPSFVTPGYREALVGNGERAVVDFAVVADAVAAGGVREIRGSVVGDGTRHSGGTVVPSWHDRYLGVDVGALGALSVNDGRAGYERTPDEPTAERPPGDPALLAAATLTTLLEQRGVTVTGEPGTGVTPPGAVPLVQHPSPPMVDLVRELLTFSDNETAELIVRELGVWAGGSTEAGLGVVRTTLTEAGVDMTGVVLVDGSGLDTANRLTCRALGDVLALEEDDPDFVGALAVAGRTGTLRGRLVGTPAEGALRAKTGSLNAVSSLSGYLTTPAGHQVRFALVLNHETATSPAVGAAVQDRVVEVLTRYPDVPAPDEVLPRRVEAAG